jgi:hypothetical protein
MGYAHYEVYRKGLRVEAGYGVEDVCNLAVCTVDIDRGLGFLCGQRPGGDEFGCGHYFCADHLFYAQVGDASVQVCEKCLDVINADLLDPDGVVEEEPTAEEDR